ncbi:MAG: V-type ATPase subunit [Methanomicrobia archaeon]|nr:V-type ATPase subunit [Methanomicrobia archaeon]
MGVSNYANVYARIRARVGDIIAEGKIRELIEARPSDFLPLLMDTAYKEQLTRAGVTTLDARRIEAALKAELVSQYVMVLRSTKGPIRGIFYEILRRLEVKNLKALLRTKATDTRTYAGVETLIFPVEDVFKRRMSKLKEVDSLADLISHMESPYREVLANAYPEYETTGRLLVLERALDEEICGAIWEQTEELGGDDREIVRKIVGTELDLTNIMTLLRCKAEGIPPSKIRSYVLPYAYRVDFGADALNEPVMAENVAAAIRAMPTSPYTDVLIRVLPLYDTEKTLIPFEDALWRHFATVVRKTLKGYPINIGTIIGFLYLKELEIQNLCSIAVGKENNLTAEEISKLMLAS